MYVRAIAPVVLLAGAILSGCTGTKTPEGDPAPQLLFSTYLGGKVPCATCSPFTFGLNAASDAAGNTYVTGATQVVDLPVKNARQPTFPTGSTQAAFVAKVDTSGNLAWCTYLGGNAETIGIGIAAMPGGGVAVVGLTTSTTGFPTVNAFKAGNSGQSDYFVSVFDGDGNLTYSTYLGGSDFEGEAGAVFADNSSNGNNVAVDARGLVYVTGITQSAGATRGSQPFPTTANAVQPGFGGAVDAFLAIIDPTLIGAGSLLYGSFLGGAANEKGHGIAVNPAGNLVTVVGYTQSQNFPTTANGFRSTPPPKDAVSNGFVAQFGSSQPGSPSSVYSKAYATYLGANASGARDDVYAVALSSAGLIHLTGRTQSAAFPMLDSSHPSIYNSAPYLSVSSSNDEPFLVTLDPTLAGPASLVYATFLGGGSTTGTGGGFCTGVAVDGNGVSYVAGETSAQGIPYQYSSAPQEAPQATPFTADALFTANQGTTDVLHMQVGADGSTLRYSTFIGGPASDRSYGLALDPSGNVVLSGLTYSTNFPVQNPAQPWPGNTGHMNAFVMKLKR